VHDWLVQRNQHQESAGSKNESLGIRKDMISSNPRQSKNSHQGTVADATEPVELEVRMEGEV
jgi:hypothetical protein